MSRTRRIAAAAAAFTLTATSALAAENSIGRNQDYGNHNFGAGYGFDVGYSAEAGAVEAGGDGRVYGRLFGHTLDIISAAGGAALAAGQASADATLNVLGQEVFAAGIATDNVERTLAEIEREFFRHQQTFTVGPIPVTVSGWATGTIGLAANAGYVDGALEVGLTPYAGLTAGASASVGVACAQAGVRGELSLLDVEAPLSAALDTVAEEVALAGEVVVTSLSGAISIFASYCLGEASMELLRWDPLAEMVIPIVDHTYAYGSENPAATCPVGSFDGANCVVAAAPSGTSPWIYGSQLMTTPRQQTSCPIGSFDGANCYVGTPYAGSSPFVLDGRGLYTTPVQQKSCPVGNFDGANCHVAQAPAGTSPFIYAGSLYTTPLAGGYCPVGGFDGANCYVATPAAGTSPFIYAGGLYTTPKTTPTCPLGSFDGANCYVATAPDGTSPFIYDGHLMTTPKSTPICPIGSFDGANCHVATAAPGTSPWIHLGQYLMTTSL